MSEILSCPFCGRQPTLAFNSNTGRMRLACQYRSCEFNPASRSWRTTKDGAIRIWNRRAKSGGEVQKHTPRLPSENAIGAGVSEVHDRGDIPDAQSSDREDTKVVRISRSAALAALDNL